MKKCIFLVSLLFSSLVSAHEFSAGIVNSNIISFSDGSTKHSVQAQAQIKYSVNDWFELGLTATLGGVFNDWPDTAITTWNANIIFVPYRTKKYDYL